MKRTITILSPSFANSPHPLLDFASTRETTMNTSVFCECGFTEAGASFRGNAGKKRSPVVLKLRSLVCGMGCLASSMVHSQTGPPAGMPEYHLVTSIETAAAARVDSSGHDYILLFPRYCEEWWRDAFIFGATASFDNRVQYYRNAFVGAIMQPELTARLKTSNQYFGLLQDFAGQSEQYADTGSEFARLLSILKSGGGIFDLHSDSIQTTLATWKQVAANQRLARSIHDFGEALGAVSLGLRVSGDIMSDLFMHEIADALTRERLDCLDRFVAEAQIDDSALIVGYALAKRDVEEFLTGMVEEYGVIDSFLRTMQERGVNYLVDEAAVPVFEEALKRYLGASHATIARVVLPYYLAFSLGVDVRNDLEEVRSVCAALTLEYEITAWESTLALPASSDPTYLPMRRQKIIAQQLRYGLGYWSSAKLDEHMAINIGRPLDWIQALVQFVTGVSGSVEDYRTSTLQRLMNENYNHTLEALPYLRYTASPIPLPPTTSVRPLADILSITPNPATQGTSMVDFTGQGDDPDDLGSGNEITGYRWISDLGATDGRVQLYPSSNEAFGPNASFQMPASDLKAGTHRIKLQVKDNDGEVSEFSEANLEVRPPNLADGHDLALNFFGISPPSAIPINGSVDVDVTVRTVGLKIESSFVIQYFLKDASGNVLDSDEHNFSGNLGPNQNASAPTKTLTPTANYQGAASVEVVVSPAADQDYSNNSGTKGLFVGTIPTFDGYYGGNWTLVQGDSRPAEEAGYRLEYWELLGPAGAMRVRVRRVSDNLVIEDLKTEIPRGCLRPFDGGKLAIAHSANAVGGVRGIGMFVNNSSEFSVENKHVTVEEGQTADFRIRKWNNRSTTCSSYDVEGCGDGSIIYSWGPMSVPVGGGTTSFRVTPPAGTSRHYEFWLANCWIFDSTAAQTARTGNAAAVRLSLTVLPANKPPNTGLTGPCGETIEQNFVDFVLTGEDDGDPSGSLEFSYRVDGNEWSAFLAERNITIGPLPNGPHQLEAKARDTTGLEDPSPAICPFTINLKYHPDTPLNVYPLAEQANVPTNVSLTASAFSDPDLNSIFAQPQFQVRADAATYDSPVWDSGENGSPTSTVQVPDDKLQPNTKYWWRVRYQDDSRLWSAWSAETSFTTAARSYTVTPIAGSNGSILPDTARMVNDGGSIRFAAVPDAGYVVDQWFVDGSLQPTSENEFELANVTGDTAVRVTFRLVPAPTYQLSITAVNGTVRRDPELAEYPADSQVVLTPTPDEWYRFSHWSGDASGSTSALTVTMDGGKNITANFTTETCLLLGGNLDFGNVVARTSAERTFTITNTGPRSVTVHLSYYEWPEFSGKLVAGDVAAGNSRPVTVTFSPTEEREYVGFVIVDSDADCGEDIVLLSGRGVTATHIVTPVAGLHGGIVPDAPQTVTQGNSIKFTAIPAAGYVVDQWFVDGSLQPTSENEFELANVTQDTKVRVTFRFVPPILSIETSGGGLALTWSGTAELEHAEKVTGPWTRIGNATSPWILAPLGAQGFYRLNLFGNPDPQNLVRIPAGTFVRGSLSGDNDEKPLIDVRLTQGFFLGRCEVTIDEYRAFLMAGGDPGGVAWENENCPINNDPGFSRRGNAFSESGSQPMVTVSWTGADAYCKWLTEREHAAGRLPQDYEYRLPTEAQWEYACRAGTTTRYSFGEAPDCTASGDFCPELETFAWWKANSEGRTQPVGDKVPNPWGLHDMHGNVWEWCADWYASPYPGGEVTDPKGPSEGTARAGRGGAWDSPLEECRSANRGNAPESYADSRIGFRVALVPELP